MSRASRSGASAAASALSDSSEKRFRLGPYQCDSVGSEVLFLSSMGVNTAPGPIRITSIPNNRSSLRNVSFRPSSPYFETLYGPINGIEKVPDVDPILMILPGAPVNPG